MSRPQWFIVVLLALGVAWFGAFCYRLLSPRPVPRDAGAAGSWQTRYVHPNVRALAAARELLAAGKLAETRAAVRQTLTVYPDSPVTAELRDLLGDVNTQIYFSRQPTARKVEYTVRRGDALAAIARRLKSTTEAIMRFNDLDSTRIRPGEQLTVPRLDFTITVDLPAQRVVVHDGDGFLTQYPIESVTLPRTREKEIETRVAATVFAKEEEGETIAQPPRILLGRTGYVLYGVGEEDLGEEPAEGAPALALNGKTESSGATPAPTLSAPVPEPPPAPPEQGIALRREDLAELQRLVRQGTPVTVIRADP